MVGKYYALTYAVVTTGLHATLQSNPKILGIHSCVVDLNSFFFNKFLSQRTFKSDKLTS